MAWVWTDDLARHFAEDELAGSVSLQRWITCPSAIRVEDGWDDHDLERTVAGLRDSEVTSIGSLPPRSRRV